MEVPQTVGGGCPNVVLESYKLVASRFALGEDMVACSEVLRAVALLGKMEEPRWLWSFVVALKCSSKEWLVGHFPDSGPSTPKSILLIALVAEVSEFQDSKLQSGPIGRPKAIQVASLER